MLTKYGIEEFLSMDYPNNMPAYKNLLSNDQIISVLSYKKVNGQVIYALSMIN